MSDTDEQPSQPSNYGYPKTRRWMGIASEEGEENYGIFTPVIVSSDTADKEEEETDNSNTSE